MARNGLINVSRVAALRLHVSTMARSTARYPLLRSTTPRALFARPMVSGKFISTSSTRARGIMPDTDEPAAKEVAPTEVARNVVDLSDAAYHELSDTYLESILTQLEEIADAKEGIDVEFSAGVLSVSFPEVGTYVINKQPPNKQIWLSSPISGPKRYDWVVLGEGQNDKEGTGAGGWMYVRDGSTLNDVFLKELGIDLSVPESHYGH